MVDRNKILSDLSKFAVDAMSTFSGVKEEIETIVSLRVNKIIKKMNLVKKDEFDALKKMVQKVMMENEKFKKTSSRSVKSKKKTVKKKKTIKKKSKR
jgi:BMFP domain-containing protein YqiC